MNVCDNIGDAEEKQAIKKKKKRATKMIEVRNRSFSFNQLHHWWSPLLSILKPAEMMDLLLNHRYLCLIKRRLYKREFHGRVAGDSVVSFAAIGGVGSGALIRQ